MKVVMPSEESKPRLLPIYEPRPEGRAAGRRGLVDGELEAILGRHHEWVASGWNVGQRAVFRDMDLHQADFQGADLIWVDLHGADLRGANLREADLESTDLRHANLRMADLRGACLQWADLEGADLRRANLEGANFHEVNLRGADLRGANLRGANLADVIGLTQPQLDSAHGDRATALPPGLTVPATTVNEKLSCVLLPLEFKR